MMGNVRILLAAWLCVMAATPLSAAGSVSQSLQQLGNSPNYVIALKWVGDASTGTVPTTSLKVGGLLLQGYLVTQVEISPGSPAPTSGYSVQLKDGVGVDQLNGYGSTLSATAAASFAVTAASPPLNGTLQLSITGQSVASAKGSVYVYLQPSRPTQILAASTTISASTAPLTVTGGGGTVKEDISQLGNSGVFVVALRWVAAADGTLTPYTLQKTTSLQGFTVSQAEIAPLSPAPTANYNMTVTDGSGLDFLGGSGLLNSATASKSFRVLAAIPPLNGSLTLKLNSNSVNAAQGVVFLYFTQQRAVDLSPILFGSNMVTSRGGTVVVYPPSIQNGNGVAVAPDGTIINCGATTTSCLQEAENYRYAHGMDLFITGGIDPPGGGVVYHTSTTLQFNPMQGVSVAAGGITINCDSTIGSSPCVQLDSAEITTIDFCRGGSIVNSGTGATLSVKPTNAVPNDVAFGIGWYGQLCVTGVVNIHSPTSDVAAVPLITFDSTLGTISYSKFDFEEVNGSGIGIQVKNPGPAKGFVFNTILAPFIHSQTGGTNPAVQVGTTAGGGAFILGNEWDMLLAGSSNTGKGVSTFEAYGIYRRIIANFGNYNPALYFETGALGTIATVSQMAGVTATPALISVGGDCVNNRIYGLGNSGPQAFGITPGASPWVLANSYCQDLLVSIAGGTVSSIQYEVTSQGPFDFATSVTAGTFWLRPGMNLKVTYSVAPTVIGVL